MGSTRGVFRHGDLTFDPADWVVAEYPEDGLSVACAGGNGLVDVVTKEIAPLDVQVLHIVPEMKLLSTEVRAALSARIQERGREVAGALDLADTALVFRWLAAYTRRAWENVQEPTRLPYMPLLVALLDEVCADRFAFRTSFFESYAAAATSVVAPAEIPLHRAMLHLCIFKVLPEGADLRHLVAAAKAEA